MLIQYSNKLTIKSIRSIAKLNKIKYISAFNKTNAIKLINDYKASTFIQKHFRKKLMRENTCPISHDLLKYPFISVKINGKFFYYDFHTFITYVNVSGDTRDPITRENISDRKLQDINKLIRYYYGKNTNKIIISKSMIKNTDLNIITYCLYDLISEINNTYNLTVDTVYQNILPRMIYYIHYLMKNHSTEDCITIINACRRSLLEINKDHVDIILDYINLIIILNFQ
jgi:hypothetical protein